MSTIRVRRIDANGDPVFGGGQKDYLTDINAMTQIIRTRLQLWQGEWWEDIKDGLPMTQKILGQVVKNKFLIDRLIQKRISQTIHVTGIASFSSSFNSSTRAYQCSVVVYTIFGTIIVSTGGI